jgi:hypothetical protein
MLDSAGEGQVRTTKTSKRARGKKASEQKALTYWRWQREQVRTRN